MPGRDKNRVLKILCEEDGGCDLAQVSSKMGMSPQYARTIVNRLRRMRPFRETTQVGSSRLLERDERKIDESS